MRLAPNRIMQKKIRDMAFPAEGKGLSAKEISKRLQIKEKAVAEWVEYFKDPEAYAKAKADAKAKK